MLVLAMGILMFMLLEMQRQSLVDTRQHKEVEIENSVSSIREKVQREGVGTVEGAAQNAVILREFQTVLGSGGALWKDGKEIRNTSPYEFDIDELKAMSKEAGLQKETILVCGPQTMDEKRLLVFYQERAGLGADGYSLVVYKDVTDIYLRTQELFLRGMGFTICLLLVIGIVLYRGIYRVVRPLHALKQTAAQIADGEFGSRVKISGKDEIGEVTVSFNRMAEKVEGHMEALSQVNEKQKQLLGGLAHELRTPLTALIGNADALMTLRLGEKNREKALRHIHDEVKRLSRLSGKMMELTGLNETGETGLEMSNRSVRKLIDRLKELTSFRLKEKRISLETSCAPADLKKCMDEDLMLSLLMNLVDNAYKASQMDSRILVSANLQGITVQDFGQGIPQEEIGRVTDAFYMVDKSRARSVGGLGLGLALCKQTIELHGGRLQIESEEGKGTKVSVLW